MADTSGRPAIFILYPLPEPALQLARSRAEVDVHTGIDLLTREQLAARLKGRQGLILPRRAVSSRGIATFGAAGGSSGRRRPR
jgi:hypothetical protein